TATVSNQAGSYRLSRGSKIVGALQAAKATMLFTDTDAWLMSYIGPPLVYGFTTIGNGCGLVAPHAAVAIAGTVYWMSERAVWRFNGSIVEQVPCPLWDYLFRDLDTDN